MNGPKKCNLRKSFKEKFMYLGKTKLKFVLHQLTMFSVIFFTLFFTFSSSALFFSCGKDTKKKIENPPLSNSVQTVEAVFEKVKDFIKAVAYVQPDREGVVKITSRLLGTVQSINVKLGDFVKKGQVLAVIKTPDTTDLYSQKIYLSAQLEQAMRLYKMKKELYEIGAIPKSDLIEAETNYKVLEAQLKGVEQKLKLLGGGMGQITIVAPLDGIVYQINAHVGDLVDQNTEILNIVRPGKILIVALVRPDVLQKLKVGDTISFYVSVYPEKEFKGIIKYISDVVDPDTRKVKVYIEPVEKELFKINMFFEVKLILGEQIYAVIPQKALIYRDGKFYVYAIDGGKPIEKEVSFIKELENDKVAILGVKEGEEIILNPLREMQP
jgi:cobalt-zinc-cadmium efflux system membrane fusion protein